eukprot:jgi/Hompol1/3722/HPOL_003337-RA
MAAVLCLGLRLASLQHHQHPAHSPSSAMINDKQLSAAVNLLGVLVFMLIILHHYIDVNSPKRRSAAAAAAAAAASASAAAVPSR